MDELPAPFTPPDCDLRGFPYVPIDIARLLDSDLYALSTGDEFKAAFSLWCKAFLQCPAGSLPDDDRILAHLSGAHGIWKKVRGMALRGFVRCSDGRLHHPVLAEKALEAWRSRERFQQRMAKARSAKAQKRNGVNHSVNNNSATEPIARSITEPIIGSMIEPVTGLKGSEVKGSEVNPPLSPPVEIGRASQGRPRDSRFAAVPEAVWRERKEPPGFGPEVNGLYLDVAWEMLAEAAGLSAEKPPDLRPLVRWLEADIYPDAIAAAVGRIAAREGYRPPRSLAYFDRAVREQLG